MVNVLNVKADPARVTIGRILLQQSGIPANKVDTHARDRARSAATNRAAETLYPELPARGVAGRADQKNL